jgi:hypothetical protein
MGRQVQTIAQECIHCAPREAEVLELLLAHSFAIEIDDILHEPSSPAAVEFRSHCEGCETCAAELAAHE